MRPTAHQRSESSIRFLEVTEKHSDGGIRFSESDCESEERADEIDNIPVNPYIYVARDGTEWKPHNNDLPDRFATRNVLRQSRGPTNFAKHYVNVSFL
ncbi:uncharacterized protein TNCV_3115831 [Trichonephila clavipes]|nr:uncharacterized protein TNCV_3115831 [Trichonephila clavipes]